MKTDINCLDFSRAEMRHHPFRHFICPEVIDASSANDILTWFEADAPWEYRGIEDFYDLFDLDLRKTCLPANLQFLVSDAFVALIRDQCQQQFSRKLREAVDVCAHRMVPPFRNGIHTDFGPTKQSHRFLVQLNRGWRVSNGGLLMLLDGEDATEPSQHHQYYVPLHRWGIAFEISETSFHAVSEVAAGDRFTLCFSMYTDDP